MVKKKNKLNKKITKRDIGLFLLKHLNARGVRNLARSSSKKISLAAKAELKRRGLKLTRKKKR